MEKGPVNVGKVGVDGGVGVGVEVGRSVMVVMGEEGVDVFPCASVATTV